MNRYGKVCLWAAMLWGCGELYEAPRDASLPDPVGTDGTLPGDEGGPDSRPDSWQEEDPGTGPEDLPPGEDAMGPEVPGPDGSEAEPGGDPGPGDAGSVPDPAFFHAVREHMDRQADDPYEFDEAMDCGGAPCLEGTRVDALWVAGDTVWAGTPGGLFRWRGGDDPFEPISAGEEPDGPVVDLAGAPDGRLLAVVLPDRIRLLDGEGAPLGTLGPLPGVAWTSAAFRPDGMLVAGGDHGVYEGLLGGFGPVEGTSEWQVRDLAMLGDRVVALLADGALRLGSAPLEVPDDVGTPRRLFQGQDRVFVAASEGLLDVQQDGRLRVVLRPGIGGLPAGDLTAVASGGRFVLVGHGIGASAVPWPTGAEPGIQHYVSQRWLPADEVTAVGVGTDLWVGTPGGLARIGFRQGRLAAKAEALFQEWMAHFWRMDGFLATDAWTDDPRQPTTWRLSDSDNDGLWTQMGIGALCMAYAVTRDERYYEAARKAMRTMFLLIDVPAVSFQAAGLPRGFISRSLVREDEPDLFASKASQPDRWHLAEYQGRRYYWKDDTSSDETTGHFFGFPLYYDLCAKDDAERAEVAEHAAALARYIVEGGFTLRDLDGQPTTFGHWEPERVAITVDGLENCGLEHPLDLCLEAEYGGGWLNATEILGHLLAAWHMTGDRTFHEAYDRLVREYRYDEVVTWSRKAITVNNPRTANHSDHELAMLAYMTLTRYEPDPDRRQRYLEGLRGLYDYERPERQPLWAAIVALAEAGVADLPGAVRTLREMPMDHRDVRVDNRHRRDAKEDVVDRFEDRQWDRVFPYDEIHLMWWNSNPYRMADGSSPRVRQSPMPFLLAYWAGRYAGTLQAPSAP